MKSEFRLPLVHNKDLNHYCAFEGIMSFTASVIKIAENLEDFSIHFFISVSIWSVGLGKILKCKLVQD